MFAPRLPTSRMARAIQFALLAAAGVAGSAIAAKAVPTSAPVLLTASDRMIVKYKPGKESTVKAAIAAARGVIKLEMKASGALSVELSAAALKTLKANKSVEFIEVDTKRFLMAPAVPLASASTGAPYVTGQQVPYGIKMVEADQLPDTYTANRKICIIDSGYDLKHPDLPKVGVTGDNDPGTGLWSTDENGHGTHVAGTIAALNSKGMGVVGVNSSGNLKLHIIKVFGAQGWAYSSTLAAAADKCGQAGANIVSMSLGGGAPSSLELNAFNRLAAKGVLSIAAAGNDGNTDISFPAGYDSVMMVGAIDNEKKWADFSQFNPKVEISAPGVSVLSTVGAGTVIDRASIQVGSSTYAGWHLDGSGTGSMSGQLVDFGFGDWDDLIEEGWIAPPVAGKICLVSRGTAGTNLYDTEQFLVDLNGNFFWKAVLCNLAGGIGVVVYNNRAGDMSGLGASSPYGGWAATPAFPVLGVTQADGALLLNQLEGPQLSTNYSYATHSMFNGTSMATPHVAAVAALVWSYFPNCTAAQMRATLTKSAEDLGTARRDVYYGYGMVRAKVAYDRIRTLGCGK